MTASSPSYLNIVRETAFAMLDGRALLGVESREVVMDTAFGFRRIAEDYGHALE